MVRILYCLDSDYNSVKWQDWIDTSSQLEAVGMLATHVHLTTTEVLSREYGFHASKLVSPKVFIECLRMAQELAVKLKTKEMVPLSDTSIYIIGVCHYGIMLCPTACMYIYIVGAGLLYSVLD